MKVRILVLTVTLFLVAAPTSASNDEPTRADVLQALEIYGGTDGGEAGETSILEWGDAAMPHLEALLGEPDSFRLAPAIVWSLLGIATPRAAEAYVQILEGKASLPGFIAASFLGSSVRGDPMLELLLAHPRFKEAVLRHMDAESTVILLCAQVGWKDQVPRIRSMFEHHPSLDVRQTAAHALGVLTGVEPRIVGPTLSFPAEDLVPGLVGKAVFIPRQAERDPSFLEVMRWFDGKPHVVCGFDPGIPSFGHRAELRVASGVSTEFLSWPVPHEVQGLVLAPTSSGGQQLIALVDQEHAPGRPSSWECVVAWDPEGKQLWRWEAERRFLDGIALLYGYAGPIGVAIGGGGEMGIAAVGLDGEHLWDVPETGVIDEIRSHPGLPGLFLYVGSDLTIYHYSSRSLGAAMEPDVDWLFEDRGLLFPDAQGRPALVLAGKTSHRHIPTICRVTGEGQKLWEARIPTEITGLEMLEPEGAPRLIVFTTDRGELFVLDDAGVLRWKGELPLARQDGGVETIRLAAGEIAPGRYGLLVRQVQSCYVLPVHVEALRSPGAE